VTGLFALELLGTSVEFVLTALVVCAVMAATLVLLLNHVREASARTHLGWVALVALVAGIGVWTTHFVAMLGFRPDAALSFDAATTLFSALVGVALVGGPIASSCFAEGARKAACGALAGAGVGAMHFTGMAALEGCSTSYHAPTVMLAFALGIVSLASALGSESRRLAGPVRAVQIVGGVCALHFTALSGLTLERTVPVGPDIDTPLLSAFVAFASVGLCLAAFAAIWSGRRVDAERRVAAAAEARQNAAFAVALRHMSNGLIMIDPAGRISAINDRARQLLHLEPEDISEGGALLALLSVVARRNGLSEERMSRVVDLHLRELTAEGASRSEEQFEDGRVLCISCRRVPEGGAVLTFDDFTEHQAAQAKIAHLAHHDLLTGLPNRRSFREEMQRRLDAGGSVAMLLLDLDRFKSINDTLGQSIGDALLVQVAERLTAELGRMAVVFRLGGDELAVLPAAPDEAAARKLADRIVDCIGKPFAIEGHTISIGCSVGVTSSAPEEVPQRVLQKADLALHRAKELGRGGVASYAEGMLETARMRRQTEADLARAIGADEFVLHFQPLWRLPDRRLLGFEALIRWNHPERGSISPAEFIPLAEETGSIREIGSWVLNDACRQLARWPEAIYVAVNVSAVQVRWPGLVGMVRSALERNGIAPARLELELTETAMLEAGGQISDTLRALRGLGVRLAMDDFGTGYSSLTHLRDFELDSIKIDRSFVNTAANDRGARAVIRAVTSMARDLSVLTVGEGVETPEQLMRLVDLGCDVAQGHLLGRPMKVQAASRLIMVQAFGDDAEGESDRAEECDLAFPRIRGRAAGGNRGNGRV
jgi:diguanylate cyclase (GGDEF)-like protein